MILITGATGFVGQHLTATLASTGAKLRIVTRRRSPPLTATDASVAALPQVSDRRALLSLMSDVRCVVHLAGLAHVLDREARAQEALFQAANVDLTEAVALAAANAGVRNFVFLSSAAVFGSTPDEDISDQTRTRPDTAYGRSKLAGERVLREVAAGTEMTAISLRPPAVWGPGMRGNPLRLMKAIKAGIPLPVRSLTAERSFVYVENLVAAIVAATQLQIPAPDAFVVSDGTRFSTSGLVNDLAQALGMIPKTFRVPVAMLRGIGRLGDALEWALPMPLTSYEVDRLASRFIVDGSRFSALSNFEPRLGTTEAMRRTAEWFLSMEQKSGRSTTGPMNGW